MTSCASMPRIVLELKFPHPGKPLTPGQALRQLITRKAIDDSQRPKSKCQLSWMEINEISEGSSQTHDAPCISPPWGSITAPFISFIIFIIMRLFFRLFIYCLFSVLSTQCELHVVKESSILLLTLAQKTLPCKQRTFEKKVRCRTVSQITESERINVLYWF